MYKNVRSKIVFYLESLMLEDSIKPEAVSSLIKYLDEVFVGLYDEHIKILVGKITDWEQAMGDDDKSLYTLGIRQAVDVLRGDSPTHAKEYKPLDEEDFRPKEETKDF
jgi:hypothetical protein